MALKPSDLALGVGLGLLAGNIDTSTFVALYGLSPGTGPAERRITIGTDLYDGVPLRASKFASEIRPFASG